MEDLRYHYKYPHPAVTTDCAIFSFDGKDLQVLLVKRGVEPYKGQWALPGGFLKPDETAEQCAARELREETGLDVSYMKQYHVFSEPNRDPRERVVTIAFVALVPMSNVIGGDDASEARWFPVTDMPELAFDHVNILLEALKYLRRQIHFEPIGFQLLGNSFTMRDLQTLYEDILGVKFDRRNFISKMHRLGLVMPTDQHSTSSRRPAQLFTFNECKYKEMKENNSSNFEF